ncbi:YitT family protein [Paenibacillus marinisediminis]
MTEQKQTNMKAAESAVPAFAPLKHGRLRWTNIIKRVFFISVGAILMAVGLELFLVPNQMTDGGIAGISIILSHLTGLPLGVFLFLLNLPFLIIGYKQIGKTFALSTLLGITVMSISTALLHPVDPFVTNSMLAVVYGGFILGIGVGITVRFGGSLDGTEIVAILFSKKSPFSVGEFVMFFNLFIMTIAGFVFGFEKAMFSLIAYYIAYKVIDITIEGLNESKSVWIISDNYKDIGDALLSRLGRGVTYMNGEGGYSGDDRKVIFTVITRLEESKLKSIVEEHDPHAFLAIGNIHDVKGGRFKKNAIH